METNNNDDYLESIVNGAVSNPKVKKAPQIPMGLDLNFEQTKKNKKENFTVHLDPEVHAALEKFAYKNRVSKSQVIEKILKQVLQV